MLYGLLVNTIWQLNVPFIRTFSASLFFAFLGSIYFLGMRLPFNVCLISRAIEFSSLLGFSSLLLYILGFNPFDEWHFL